MTIIKEKAVHMLDELFKIEVKPEINLPYPDELRRRGQEEESKEEEDVRNISLPWSSRGT